MYWGFRRWRRGDEELELTLLPLLCSRERISVDIGANFGMWTVRMLPLSRRCIAFEPIPAFARMLARGFGSGLEVHAVALSDHSGTAELRIPHLYTGYSTIDAANRLESRQAGVIDCLKVDVARLDDYGFADVGFVKIDVEGHEEAVLRGCESTLDRTRPNVIVEVEERHNPGSVGRVVTWMRERGFAASSIVGGVAKDLAHFDLAEHQRTTSVESYARNIVFVPDERRADLWDSIALAVQ